MSANERLGEQLNVRVPAWLKAAVEREAKRRCVRGARVTAADVAREVLCASFENQREVEAK